MARPMPRPAPVTMATFPSNLPIFCSSFSEHPQFCNRTLYRPQRSERRFLRFGQASNTGDVHSLVEPVSHHVHALACPYIPADNGSVLTCAHHHPPIGAKDHCPYPPRMTVQRVEARSAAHFPHPHCSVMPPTGKRGAIRAEGDRLYPRVPLQYLEALARAHFPHPHRPIITAAGKHGTIRAEGDRLYRTRVPLQYLEALARAHFPHPHRPIV